MRHHQVRPYTHGYHVYRTWRHLAVTLAFVALPVVYFLLFTGFARIEVGPLLLDAVSSIARLFGAYAIAVTLGWLLAVTFYRGRRATVGLPVFDVLQSFPTFALLPLITLLWGGSDKTITFFMVITIIWPIFFTVVSQLKLLKQDWREASQIYGLSGWRYVRTFLWPATLPGLITGSIIGLGEGWEAIVATEIIVHARVGLGDFFQRSSGSPGLTAFGVLGLLLFIFCLNKLIWLPLLEWSHRRNED